MRSGFRHARKRLKCALGGADAVEAFENRRLLSTLTVNGTGVADTITVDLNGTTLSVTVNGSTTTHNAGSGGVSFVEVVAGAGADNINIVELQSLGIEVRGGDGNDTITLGGGDIDNNFDSFTNLLYGGAGSDTVVFDDSTDAGDDGYVFGEDSAVNPLATRFEKTNDTQLYIQMQNDIQAVRLICNGGNNTIEIVDRVSMEISSFDIEGRNGNDILNHTRLNGIATVNFDGDAGADTLTYQNDQSFAGTGAAIEVIPTSVAVNATTVASWTGMQQVNLLVDFGPDAVDIDSTGAGTTYDFDAGDGADTITVGAGDIDANIVGNLNISDFFTGDGDRIVFSDALNTTADSYSLLPGSFTKTGLAIPISFGNLDQWVLNANGGNNAITARAQSFVQAVTINAGAGNDTLNYQFEDFGADTTLNGGTGIDVLNLSDPGGTTASVTDKNYSFTAGVITQTYNNPTTVTHAYTSWNSVTLQANALDNEFLINSLNAETTLNLVGGLGNDQVDLRTTALPSTTISYSDSGGSDTVSVDDSADTFTADTYTLGSGTFDKTDFGLLNFTGTDAFVLRASPTASTINVVGLNTPTTVTGGNAPDTITVGSGDIEADLAASLSVVGQQGGDRLIINDSLDVDANTWTFGGGTVAKASMPGRTISHGFCESLEVNAGPAEDTFDAANFGFPLNATLRGAAGADRFNITPGTTILTLEGSDPTVAPGDVLSFVNAAAAGTATFTPNGAVNGSYAFAAADPVTFFGLETFPAVPSVPSVPNLIAASDSGVSATDNITNDTTPSFDVIGESGVTVELLVNGTVVSSTSTPITGSIYRLTTPALADGTYDVASRQRATASGLTGPVSSALSVTIDTIAPAAPGAPDLTAASDTGQSATDNVTRDNTPTFQLTAPSDATVQLLRGGATVIGSLQLTTGGLISITADAQVDGTFTVTARASDVAGNTSTVSGGLTMTIDTVAPTVTSVAFAFETEHALSYGFSESLGNSLQVADLTLQNLTSATTIPAGSIALSGTTFRFPVLAGGILTDGNYRTTLVAAGVTDIAGNSLPSDHLFDFFVLSGDANRDRSVDIGDFSILAARFNLPGTFSQGDFNYSGATEIGDFAILASKFNTSLPAARSPSPRAAAGERRTVADAIDRLSDELLEIRPGPYTDGDAWIY